MTNQSPTEVLRTHAARAKEEAREQLQATLGRRGPLAAEELATIGILVDSLIEAAVLTVRAERIAPFEPGTPLGPGASLAQKVDQAEAWESALLVKVPEMREEIARLQALLEKADPELQRLTAYLAPLRDAEPTTPEAPANGKPAHGPNGLGRVEASTTIPPDWTVGSMAAGEMATIAGVTIADIVSAAVAFREAMTKAGEKRARWGAAFRARFREFLPVKPKAEPAEETEFSAEAGC